MRRDDDILTFLREEMRKTLESGEYITVGDKVMNVIPFSEDLKGRKEKER